jgi:Uncharacterized protein conserved in bacteria (DUF2219)
MYTPENFRLFNPDPHDRPFAGWLYSGVGMMQDTKGTQDNIDRFDELALKLGIVGPGSLAHFSQTRYHLLIHVEPFQGWHAQLRNEPALDLFYQRKWRFHHESAGGWGWDAIPRWDMRVGNAYDYLGAGGLLRFGRNLRADYGPPHIDLNTGADYINESRYTDGRLGSLRLHGRRGARRRPQHLPRRQRLQIKRACQEDPGGGRYRRRARRVLRPYPVRLYLCLPYPPIITARSTSPSIWHSERAKCQRLVIGLVRPRHRRWEPGLTAQRLSALGP